MSTSLFMKVVPFDLNAGLARVDTRILNLHTRAPRIGGERCLPKSISSGDTSPRVLTWRSRILYCLSSMEVGTQMEMKGSRHFIALCPLVSHKLTGFWFQHHRTFWQLLKSITNCLLLSCAVCSHCGLNVVRTMQIPTRVSRCLLYVRPLASDCRREPINFTLWGDENIGKVILEEDLKSHKCRVLFDLGVVKYTKVLVK